MHDRARTCHDSRERVRGCDRRGPLAVGLGDVTHADHAVPQAQGPPIGHVPGDAGVDRTKPREHAERRVNLCWAAVASERAVGAVRLHQGAGVGDRVAADHELR
ncbi:MAG: hypothetical protein ACK55I_13730, partial [bacterium]